MAWRHMLPKGEMLGSLYLVATRERGEQRHAPRRLRRSHRCSRPRLTEADVGSEKTNQMQKWANLWRKKWPEPELGASEILAPNGHARYAS
jgi:hypothetical protein